MPNIPAPLYALVGATDAAAEKARTLSVRLAEYSANRSSSLNIDLSKVDISKLEVPKVDLSKVDLSKADPRKANLRQVELPKVDIASVAGTALELAAKAERAYEDFVTRGVDVVDRVTSNGETSDVPETPVATPDSASTAKAAKTAKATPKTTKSSAASPPAAEKPKSTDK